MTPIETRLKSVKRIRSFRERLSAWWHGVWNAINEPQPKEAMEFVGVNPGDPDYESAHWTMGYTAHPLRFRFDPNTGLNEIYDPEKEPPCEPNPDYKTP